MVWCRIGNIRYWWVILFVVVLSFVNLSCTPKGERPQEKTNTIVTNQIKPDEPERVELELKQTLTGHHQYIFYVAFNPEGQLLASGSADETVRVWNYTTGKQLFEKKEVYNEIWGIPVDYSPNGRYLAMGAYETLKILDTKDGYKEIASVLAHKRGIQSLYISPDNKYVVTAGVDGNLIVWTIPDLQKVSQVKGHASEIWNVCVSPNGKYVLSGGEDAYAKIWQMPDLKLYQEIKYHDLPIEYVRFSGNNEMFLLGSADMTTTVWKWGQYKTPYRTLKGHVGSVLVAIFTPDNKFVVSGGDDDEVYVFDIKTGEISFKMREHFGDVMTLAISPDGKTLASGSRDKTIKLWEIIRK